MIHVMRQKKTSFLSVDDLTRNCILKGSTKAKVNNTGGCVNPMQSGTDKAYFS